MGGAGARAPDEIVVSAGRIEQLALGFTRTWQRPPTQQELVGLIDDYVNEEVLYREALALGLDRDDLIVRRRMRQKMEFLGQDSAPLRKPSDSELVEFLRANPEKFREEPRLSFVQLYLSAARRGEAAARDGARLVAELNERAPSDLASLGDPLPLPQEVDDRSVSEIEREFGGELAARVLEVEPERWAGPFASAFGLHVVLLRSRTEARLPALEEVRASVEREWGVAQRERAEAERMARLRERYRVTIEPPDDRRAVR
ncbi:MAG TPA: peptidylprolyl isomerase [Myxococcota bacterium]|nr:peptidylprolyl isomerase [Myxococcota bacterium]